jgi:hypothetical protein
VFLVTDEVVPGQELVLVVVRVGRADDGVAGSDLPDQGEEVFLVPRGQVVLAVDQVVDDGEQVGFQAGLDAQFLGAPAVEADLGALAVQDALAALYFGLLMGAFFLVGPIAFVIAAGTLPVLWSIPRSRASSSSSVGKDKSPARKKSRAGRLRFLTSLSGKWEAARCLYVL